MSTPEPRVKIIENATRDDVQSGDHFVWEETWTAHGVTFTNRREGTAHHRNNLGAWETTDGGWLPSAEGEGVTLTLRRPVQDLPTNPGAVLDPAEGYEYITATVAGVTYRAREAMLLEPNYWHAAWRSDEGVMTHVTPEHLDAGTWKKGTR